jgi:hypothetical protein
MDPRVRTPQTSIATQFSLSKGLYDDVLKSSAAIGQIRALRVKIRETKEHAGAGAVSDALEALDKKAQAIEGAPAGGRGGGRGALASGPDTFSSVNGSLMALMQSLQSADVAPATQTVTAVNQRRAAMARLMQRWSALQTSDLIAVNGQLTKANLPALKIDKESSPAEMDDDEEDDDIG